MALTSIASCGEAACKKILNPSSSEKKVNGLMVFVAVVKEQSGDKQGMEEFVMLVDELIQEDSVKGILFFQKRSSVILDQLKKCKPLKSELKKLLTKYKNMEKLCEIISAL